MAAYQIFREAILLLNIAQIYTMATESTDSDDGDGNKAAVLQAVGIAIGVICMLIVVFAAFMKRECLATLFSPLISLCCRIQNVEKFTVQPVVKFDTSPMCRNPNQSDNLQTEEADYDEQTQNALRIITIEDGTAAAAVAATDDDNDDAEDYPDINDNQSLLK